MPACSMDRVPRTLDAASYPISIDPGQDIPRMPTFGETVTALPPA